MRFSTKMIDFAAACAACCAVSIVSWTAAAIGIADWKAGGVASGGVVAALLVAILVLRNRRQSSDPVCKLDGGCGCEGMKGNR